VLLKRILLALVLLIAVLVVVVALQPADFRITRSARIAAPAAKIFDQVNNFHSWQAWSPWAKLDPAATNTYAGPDSGAGAVFKWSGNSDVGEGSMTLLDSQPSELIRIRLDFIRPMEDTSTVEFTFQPAGDQTDVTWTMFGRNNFIGKAFCLFFNMEKTVGGQFEQGLASLSKIVEVAP
jgi:hypothetical protein